jgi:protein-tyrosine-phosphatase
MAAAALVARAAPAAETLEVRSAGVAAVAGAPATELARMASAEAGQEILNHTATPLDSEQLEWADVVLCMEEAHAEAVRGMGGGAPRTELFAAEHPALPGGEVPDPVGRGVDYYRAVREVLDVSAARFLAREGLVSYAPFFCEENAWHVCQDERIRELPRRVVFISNSERTCALWYQRAALVPDSPVVWDYHAVVLVEREGAWEVWDHDCTAGWQLSATRWLHLTFGLTKDLPKDLHPLFRVLDADVYVERFSSDRAHMIDEAGNYRQQPPPWPPIVPEGVAPNLQSFVDVEADFLGEVLSLDEMEARYGSAG